MSTPAFNFNERERKRYRDSLHSFAKSVNDCAAALESGDDGAFLVALITLSLRGEVLNELREIVSTSLAADAPNEVDHTKEAP